MYNIEITNTKEHGAVVSSRVIADELGKRRSDVLISLNNILTNGDFRSLIIPSEYKDKKGETRKEYLLTKDGFTLYMFNIQGHNDFKMAYINRFNEMEKQLIEQTKDSYMIDDPVERAKRWIEEQEEKENLLIENNMKSQKIGELEPKAEYYDLILQNKGLVNIGQIAKDYGMTAQKMNKTLSDLKIQYRQSGQWLLYRQYHDKGYTHSDTQQYTKSDGKTGVNMHTKWTQKGRIFLYNTLKENGIIPVIEQDFDELEDINVE